MSSRPLSSLPLPASMLSRLTRAGYATTQDLQTTSAENLAQDLGIDISEAQMLLLSPHKSNLTQRLIPPTLTQSAASMTEKMAKISTKSPALDDLLSGGLSGGQILEVSGPPGTPKETIAINIATSFVEAGHEVIFIDSQNMTSPATLDKIIRTSSNASQNYSRLVYHLSILRLVELMVFIHNLPKLLESYPKARLLVFNSISFPFQSSPDLTIPAKSALLEKIKQTLTIVSSTLNVTIITTSQLSTKIIKVDGSSGNFDTGGRGMIVPHLGLGYLPGRAYRVILAAEGPTSGVIKLISTPGDPQGTNSSRSLTYDTSEAGLIR